MTRTNSDTAVIFSGGTDSTCAAALAAEKHSRVHLLTYYESATERQCAPRRNLEALRARFPATEFYPHFVSVDRLVRHLSYDKYWHYLRTQKALVLATCGFSTLSWHACTILYCLENGIHTVSDGLTRELMHFPGHMDEVIDVSRNLYSRFGIEYSNPVRDWAVPADRQFIDQVIVNTHGGDFILEENNALRKTTGRYLHDIGIMPSPDVKGTNLDRLMQQDCYPFAVYNIMTFWCFLAWEPYPKFCDRMRSLFAEKAEDVRLLIEEHRAAPENSELSRFIEKPRA